MSALASMNFLAWVRPETLSIIDWVCGFVILMEALNKLERCNILGKGLTRSQRADGALKATAWAFLAVASGEAFLSPLLHWGRHATAQEASVMLGFMLLVIRARLQETLPGHKPETNP